MDNNTWSILISAFIAAFAGIMTAMISRRIIKDKGPSGAAEDFTGISLRLTKKMEEKLQEAEHKLATMNGLESRVQKAEEQVLLLCKKINQLIHQIKSLGHEPIVNTDDMGCGK